MESYTNRCIAAGYRRDHTRMQEEIMDLAMRAEAKGFPLLAEEIIAFGVDIAEEAPMYRRQMFAPRMEQLYAALREVNLAWLRHDGLIKPAVFEAAYLVD